jgi:NitT/TauT family transport system substrate-binding protein
MLMRRRQIVTRFGALALASLVLAACVAPPSVGSSGQAAPQGKPEQASIKVALVPGDDFLTLYLAKERGLFEKEGLSVELVQFNAAPDALSTLVAGQVDLGATGMTEVITAQEAGTPIKGFWTLTRAMPYEIWGKSDYADLKAAKGARFAISKYGAISDFFTRYAVQKSGLDPYKDVQVIQIGGTGQRTSRSPRG